MYYYQPLQSTQFLAIIYEDIKNNLTLLPHRQRKFAARIFPQPSQPSQPSQLSHIIIIIANLLSHNYFVHLRYMIIPTVIGLR